MAMGGIKPQGMVVLIGGWRYSLTQSFGFSHFALGVGDLKLREIREFSEISLLPCL
jgi:hypothetical protein